MKKLIVPIICLILYAGLATLVALAPSHAQTYGGVYGLPTCPPGDVPTYDTNGRPGVCSSSSAASTFNTITTGTNTAATMTVGSGASIVPSGTGVVDATECNGGSCGGGGGAWTNITGTVTASGCTVSSLACTVATPGNSVTLSSIPQTYHHLFIEMMIRTSDTTSTLAGAGVQFNSDTAAHYDRVYYGYSNTVANGNTAGDTSIENCTVVTSNSGNSANTAADCNMWIYNYTDTAFDKNTATQEAAFPSLGTVAGYTGFTVLGDWRSTAAITSVTILDVTGGNLVAGSRITIYGVN